MDINKGYKVVQTPIIAIIAIAVVAALVGVIPFLNVLICILGLPILIANIVLYAYIGYLLQKAGMELVDSAVLGAVVSLVAGIISLVISLVAGLLGFSIYAGVGFDMAAVIVTSIFGIVVNMIIAAVVAAVGYLIAGAMKK